MQAVPQCGKDFPSRYYEVNLLADLILFPDIQTVAKFVLVISYLVNLGTNFLFVHLICDLHVMISSPSRLMFLKIKSCLDARAPLALPP